MTKPVRSCGGCTACCKPLRADDIDIRKPAGVWCQHCNIGKGCKIYETRPSVCRDFRCEWMKGFGEECDRPDKVKVIVDFHKLGFFEEGMCELWEVSEGALARPYVARVTRWMLNRDIPVTHRPLGNKRMRVFLPQSLMYKEVFEALAGENIELASLVDL